eukprot:gene20937-27785_t
MNQQDGRNPRTRGHTSQKTPLSSCKPGRRKRRNSNQFSAVEAEGAAPSDQVWLRNSAALPVADFVETPGGAGKLTGSSLWISPSNSVLRESAGIERNPEEQLEGRRQDSLGADDIGDFKLFCLPEFSRALPPGAASDEDVPWEENTKQIEPSGWDTCYQLSAPHGSHKRPRHCRSQDLDRCKSASKGLTGSKLSRQAVGSCISFEGEAAFFEQGVESCAKVPGSTGEGGRSYSRDLSFLELDHESCGRESSLGRTKSESCGQGVTLTKRWAISQAKGDSSIMREPGSCCKSTARAERASSMSLSNITLNPESQAGHSSRGTLPYQPLNTHTSLDFSFELPPLRLDNAYGSSRAKNASLASAHAGQGEGEEISSQPLPNSLRVKTSREHPEESDQSGQITPDLSHPEPIVKFLFDGTSSSQELEGTSQEQGRSADARDKSFSDPLIFDPPLTELGHKQARRLRPKLKSLLATYGQPLWVISPLTRAIQTFLDACPEVIASQPSAANEQPTMIQPTSGQGGHTVFQTAQPCPRGASQVTSANVECHPIPLVVDDPSPTPATAGDLHQRSVNSPPILQQHEGTPSTTPCASVRQHQGTPSTTPCAFLLPRDDPTQSAAQHVADLASCLRPKTKVQATYPVSSQLPGLLGSPSLGPVMVGKPSPPTLHKMCVAVIQAEASDVEVAQYVRVESNEVYKSAGADELQKGVEKVDVALPQAEAADTAHVEVLPLVAEYLRTAGDVGRPASVLTQDFPQLSAQLSKLPEHWWHQHPGRPNCALNGIVESLESKEDQKTRLSEFMSWLGSREENFIIMVGHASFWASFLPSSHSFLANGEMVLLSW